MSRESCYYSLPPNVDGKCRGFFQIRLNDLIWNANNYSKYHPVGSALQARLIWWGESSRSAATLRLDPPPKRSTKSDKQQLCYNIQTNCQLFAEYLATCEPLEIKLTTIVSHLQIGVVYVKIPHKIVQFLKRAPLGQTDFQCKAAFKVLNAKNTIIGDCPIDFKINLLPAKETPRSDILPDTLKLNKKILSERSEKSVSFVPSQLGTPKKPSIPEMYAAIRYETLSNDSHRSAKSSVYNYLTGQKMTRQQEIEALNEIRSISPTNSFIEKFNNTILYTKNVPATRSMTDSLLQKIDSIKIEIEKLTLTKCGCREVINIADKWIGGIFVIKCKYGGSSNLKYKFDFKDDEQIWSNNVEDFSASISICTTAIRSMRLCENDANSSLIFSVWFRETGSITTKLLGTTKISLKLIIDSNDLTLTIKSHIKSIDDDILLGSLQMTLKLGCRRLHFGSDFLDAIYYNKENECHEIDLLCDDPPIDLHNLKPNCARSTCCNYSAPRVADKFRQNSDSQPTSTTTNDSPMQQSSRCEAVKMTSQPTSTRTNVYDNLPDNLHTVKSMDRNNEPIAQKHLYGLLYIGLIYHVKEPEVDISTFLICRSFWKNEAIVTPMCQENNFNFMETFPIVCDSEMFERCKNQHMTIEMWQKRVADPVHVLGTTQIPLQQFHVAFRDPLIMEHLSKSKMPVISIDGWTNVVSLFLPETIAKIQVMLAIGTEEQLNNLKTSRGLVQQTINVQSNANFQHISIPAALHLHSMSPAISNACTQTTFNSVYTDAEIQTNLIDDEGVYGDDDEDDGGDEGEEQQTNIQDRQVALSEMLNNFIDNLASRLPERQTDPTQQTIQQSPSSGSGVHIRRTSDLLDALQQALMCPPTQPLMPLQKNHNYPPQFPLQDFTNSHPPQQKPQLGHSPSASATSPQQPQKTPQQPPASQIEPVLVTDDESDLSAGPAPPKHFQVLIEIENALHISTIMVKVNINIKKRCKFFRRQDKEEPSTYVTFEAVGPPTNIVQSHDGPVYTTNVVEKSCCPQWNKRFEVMLPTDLITNDEKRFILKIWRKASTDIPHTRLLPTPMEDVEIGFTTIDLSVFLVGMPTISGWYNIVEYSGRINGQIKVNIQPMEDLSAYRQDMFMKTIRSTPCIDTYCIQPLPQQPSNASTSMMQPLSLDCGSSSADLTNTVLSRTLKRKFTELEEITQRLRARLFDVTGDEAIDPDDEFENDLNTNPEESDEDLERFNNGESDFNWMSQQPSSGVGAAAAADNNEQFNGEANQFQTNIATQSALDGGVGGPSTILSNTMYTNESSEIDSVKLNLDSILKEHDIDTIVNPSLFNKFLNPLDATTSDESTPRLLAAAAAANKQTTLADSSSTSEQDRIRLIETALMRAVLNDPAAITTADASNPDEFIDSPADDTVVDPASVDPNK